MKDSNLIENVKSEMAMFLNLSPEENNLSFDQYFEIAVRQEKDGPRGVTRKSLLFAERFYRIVSTIASNMDVPHGHPIKPNKIIFEPCQDAVSAMETLKQLGYIYKSQMWIPPLEKTTQTKPNIIFGVLTNGEIFVEVGGEQHTPDDSFYKMAAIQSSILAHQVRDLELKNKALINAYEGERDKAEKLALFSNSISNAVYELGNEGGS